MDNLFSTHPSTENRIAALREMAGMMGGNAGRPAYATSVPSSAPRRGPWG